MPDPPAFMGEVGALVDRFLAKRLGPDVRVGKEGEEPARSADLKFTGRVFVYAENDLAPDQVVEIAERLRKRDL